MSYSRKNMHRLTIAFALAVVLTGRAARADETEGARLFREGRALMLEGRFDEACPKIAESQRLEPHVGTLLNLAACHERQGKLASAWVEYQKALTAARAEGQTERARLAQQRIDALEPRVPWLAIAVDGDDVAVTLDGAAIAPAAWGKEMPVDPGAHVVTASAAKRRAFEERFVLAESEHKKVAVPPPEPDAPPPAPPPPQRTIVVEPAPPPPPKTLGRSRWLFEAGLFVAPIHGNLDKVYPDTTIGIVKDLPAGGQQASTCGCTYSVRGAFDGTAFGVNLFGGYALTERHEVGGRLLFGPVAQGGSLVAVGPALMVNVVGPVWTGVSVLFGTASMTAYGDVEAQSGYRLASGGPFKMHAATDGAFGAALEVDVRLLQLPRGSLSLGASTLFLLGAQGNAFALPLTVAYHFQ